MSTYLAAFTWVYAIVKSGCFISAHTAQYGCPIKFWVQYEERKKANKINSIICNFWCKLLSKIYVWQSCIQLPWQWSRNEMNSGSWCDLYFVADMNHWQKWQCAEQRKWMAFKVVLLSYVSIKECIKIVSCHKFKVVPFWHLNVPRDSAFWLLYCFQLAVVTSATLPWNR